MRRLHVAPIYGLAFFMTDTRVLASVLGIVACLMFWSMLMLQDVQAQDSRNRTEPTAARIHFALPAQPLASAIRAYERATDMLVMADTPLLDDRTSAPLNGDYVPQEALEHLLAGTGLDAHFTSADSVVIVPQTATPQPDVAPSATAAIPAYMIDGLGEGLSYAILIQSRLTDLLCQSAQTRPGNYRLVVQLRIDGSGKVTASKLVDSTGDSARDAAIEHALRYLMLDTGPPATLSQPVTILIRPEAGAIVSGCGHLGQQG